jgi:hypothetical protein
MRLTVTHLQPYALLRVNEVLAGRRQHRQSCPETRRRQAAAAPDGKSLLWQDAWAVGFVTALATLLSPTMGPEQPSISFEVQTAVIATKVSFFGPSAFAPEHPAARPFERCRTANVSDRVLWIGSHVGKDAGHPRISGTLITIHAISTSVLARNGFLAPVFERITLRLGVIAIAELYRTLRGYLRGP